MKMLNSVRARLTLLYVLIFGVLLVAFSVAIYALIYKDAHDRFDGSLTKAARTVANLFHHEMIENGQDEMVATAHTIREYKQQNLFLAIFRDDRLVAANHNQNAESSPADKHPAAAATKDFLARAIATRDPVLTTAAVDGQDEWRLVAYAPGGEAAEYVIVVAESRRELIDQMLALRKIFLLSLPAMLLVAGLAGYLLARKSLAPISGMTAQAERISAENLHERLPVKNKNDELGRLARVFNELLARLESSFDGMRQLTADASHELRTPLAIIRGEADVALSQEREPVEYRETLSIIQDEAQRLSGIVEDMLALARADSGQRRLRLEEFYFNDLIEECVRSARALALNKNISLNFDPSGDIVFRGDEDLLRRMILNLLDNAIKYTPGGGMVTVKLWRESDQVKLCVADTGIGIPTEAAARVFERFYRVDKARSRAEGGSGLGLPIVKWIAEAHRGSVRLESAPERGSSFTIELPDQS
ncbi:MAG: Adaptive-response sensory-kinase SasA [Acidobacteria bacterium]|nr:Adaptive-response sensory-kinase SasA [Acidobacteriota bacterium]